MSRVQLLQSWVAAIVVSAGIAVLPAMAAGSQTFTGKVSDAMCGAKHEEGIDPATCVRECVKKGANYALVVGDKVYTLDTATQAEKDELDKLAWQQATIKGTANGNTIEVKSVMAAK